jgi:WD40 repeat protein
MNHAPISEVTSSGEQIFDISFHPTADFLAVGTITGAVEVYNVSNVEHVAPAFRLQAHEQGSCRGVAFSEDGERLYTISSDQTWKIVDGRGDIIHTHVNAHDSPINKIVTAIDNPHTFATGDDSGCVKLWDSRTPNPTMTWHLHEDFVADFAVSQESQSILSVGGDATLCYYDLRKHSNAERSDDQEAELHCVDIIKHGKKVVAGTQDGVILVFSWGRWGDCSDRYPGHPETIDCMYKVDENTICTGSSDGMIRVVAIQPNKILGVLGDHEDFPVEGMQRNRDGRVLASYSHDNRVRFWDVSMFADDVDEDPEDTSKAMSGLKVVEGEAGTENMQGMKIGGDMVTEGDDDEGDWEDMEDSEEEEMDDSSEGELMDDSDEDDDDDDNGDQNQPKILSASEKFFADL